MERKNKKFSRSEEVYQALLDKKFPEELCREIAYKYMTTDYTEQECWVICTASRIQVSKW